MSLLVWWIERGQGEFCRYCQSYSRPQSPQLVALCCHYDVIDWLQPDWVYDVSNSEFTWRSLLPGSRSHPEIHLNIYQASHRAWPMFRGHHYLTKSINQAAQCFVATWRNEGSGEGEGNEGVEVPVAFTSYLHFSHHTVKNIKRGHRTVVLPDYQGVGIGNRLAEWVGAYCKSLGFRYRSVSSHPSMLHHRAKSPLWVIDRLGHVAIKKQKRQNVLTRQYMETASHARITGSFEYVGPALPR